MIARRKFTVVAYDPKIELDGEVLFTEISVPREALDDGPRGYRVAVIDYDASQEKLYAPPSPDETFELPAHPEARRAHIARLLADPRFHAQSVYAIAMRTLTRFEHALGRRVGWGFDGQQLKIAPHAFEMPNAFYSKQDQALMFGYFQGSDGWVFTSLAHDVVVHETTHAILDGLRERYVDLSHPDQAGFHEGFADVVALLSVYSSKDVVSAVLSRSGGDRATIATADLHLDKLRESPLFAIAAQLGSERSAIRGDALRRSVKLDPSIDLASQPAFQEPHRRGELLVAAMMRTFLHVWLARVATLGEVKPGYRDRERVIEEGAEVADCLLTLAIRALDYTPPVDVRFGDYLSAMLTSDTENRPDDGKYRFRELLIHWFGQYGIAPASHPDTDGCWEVPPPDLVYSSTHFESLRTDETEVFRFLWENHVRLGVHNDAYSRVMSVRPCTRVVQDGFTVRETIAEYKQVIHTLAGKLPDQVTAPAGMPPDLEVALHGGGTLVFDEYGRLKYHVYQRPASARQTERLAALWGRGLLRERRRSLRRPSAFAALHLQRALSSVAPRGEEV